MQSVSADFLTQIKSAVRTLYGRIIIDYTNSIIDTSITVTANETANVNHADQVANSVEDQGYKYAAFDGLWELDGTWALAPSNGTEDAEFGWWGSSMASTADKTFSVPYPLLTVDFFSRPIRSLKAVGDNQRNEYPVDFEVKLYQTGSVLAHTETVTDNYYPFEGVTNWTAVNTLMTLQSWQSLSATISWSAEIAQVNSIVQMTLEITKWSHEGRQAKITEFYSSIQETYEGDDIVDFVVTEERDIANGSLPIGNISANEITLKLNNIDNRFDAGNTASATFGLLKSYRRVRAWIGCKLSDDSIEYVPMGTFWSGDWETPENDIYAATAGLDEMERMRKTTYSTNTVAQNITLYTLAETVLQDYGLTTAEYTIDTELQDYTVPYAWFDPVSHREALRKIVEACAGQAYVDRDGIVQVQGPSFLDAATANLTISLDDIWDKSNPVKWSQISNYIQASVKPLTLAGSLSEVYRSPSTTLSASGTKTYTVQFNSTPCISAVASITATLTATTTITDTTYYSWGAAIEVTNAATASDTFSLIVQALTLTEENIGKVVSQDADSILDNGKLVYTVPENNLIQTTAFAETLTDKILSVFKDPRRDITINWRGNPALELADRITAPDYKDQSTQDYFITKQTFEFDGGLDSTIDGRKAG